MTKKISLTALLLLVPAPSIGVLAGMIIFADQPLGKSIFFASKLWILLLPLAWILLIDKQKLSLSKPTHGGFAVATALGVAISAIIFIAYITASKYLIDPQMLKDMAANVGLSKPAIYLGGTAYWVLVNAVLEEYVWRWFVVSRCENLMPRKAAIAASALGFTIHHIIAMQIYFSWPVTAIASVGLFIGAAAWSWCYIKYRSIWPGYVSHAIVDIAVFAIGYHLIFT